MEIIASVSNPRIKNVCLLHSPRGRREQKRYLIEGWHLLDEALKRQMPIETIYCSGEPAGADLYKRSALIAQAVAAGTELIEVSENVMGKIATTRTPQGVAAVLCYSEVSRSLSSLGDSDIILLLDRIQDPGNLGGILRVALAASVHTILLTPGSADPYGPKALRGGMGSHFGLRVLADVGLPECTDLCAHINVQVMALTAGGKSLYDEENQCQEDRNQCPLILILGNEGRGIAPELLEWAHEHRSLPMCYGVDSLNVAVTAGIVLYEIKRRRKVWKTVQY